MSAASAVRPVRSSSRPTTAALQPVPARTAAQRIRVVAPPASSRRRMPFGLLCGLVVAASLLAVLLLNISLSHGSYALHSLSSEQARLDEQRDALAERVERAATPEALADRATALGMVPAGSPAFIRLPDGAVLGDPEEAGAPAVGAAPAGTSETSASDGSASTGGADGEAR